jgi:membrane-bound inhibitor of C-type lysozyme/uncharacterized membrane protein
LKKFSDGRPGRNFLHSSVVAGLVRKLVWLVGGMVCAACAGSKTQAAPEDFIPDSRPLGKTLVYECGDYEFIARIGPGEMAVWLTDQYLVLSQVRSGSGTRYEEGDVRFWSKGEEAMLEVSGRLYQGCSLSPRRVPWEDARRRGVDFRGAGNEPGWYIEIQEGRQILYVGDYGMDRMLVSATEPGWQGSTRIYQSGDAEPSLRVEIVNQRCVDTMAGSEFPSTVMVIVDGKGFHGCGMDLERHWE